MKHYFAEWDYRFGWGYYSAIYPKEVVDAGASNWKNVNGTGPYTLTEFISGNSNVYAKNPDYWDKEKIGGQEYKLPFVDKITYRTIKDEATYITALRTGKLDILEAIRWQNVDSLEEERAAAAVEPLAEPVRHLHGDAHGRRRAVQGRPRAPRAQQAVNKDEIVKAYYNGNAELFAYPQHPDYVGYFEPLDEQPASVQELFKYDPAKAKKLLAEAGLPQGLHHQGAGLLVQSRPHGPAAAGRGLPRAGRREARDPAAGVRRLPVGDDLAHAYAGLLHEQRPHQPDHDHPQELHHRPAVESRRAGRDPEYDEKMDEVYPRAGRGQAPARCCAR